MKVISVIFMLMSLSACSTFSKSSERNLYQVHVGQSRAELVSALGDPRSKDVQGSKEIWYYEIYSLDNRRLDPYTATFENDRLTQWNFDTARNSEPENHYFGRTPTSFTRPY